MRVVLSGIFSDVINQIDDWHLLGKSKSLTATYLGVPFVFKGKDPRSAAVCFPEEESIDVPIGAFLSAVASLLFLVPSKPKTNLVARVWVNPIPEQLGLLIEGGVSEHELLTLFFYLSADRAWVMLPGSSLGSWTAVHAEFGIELTGKGLEANGSARNWVIMLRIRASSRNQMIEAVQWASKVFPKPCQS